MKQFSIHNQYTKTSNMKWPSALVPAIAVGALAFAFWGRPGSTPIAFNSAAIPSPVTVLPLSSTFVVGADSTAKPLTARGHLTVFNPQVVAAPAAGMVARLLVQPGQIVKAGDTIAMISSQAVPAVEKSRVKVQRRAESAQEEAVRQQNVLEGKLAQEKVLLKIAQKHVDAAASQLTYSRDLLRRLQNGEKIPRSQVADDIAHSASKEPSNSPPKEHSAAAIAQANQEADRTAKIAAEKWQFLSTLFSKKSTAPAKSTKGVSNAVPTQKQIDAANADAKAAQDAADTARMKAFKMTEPNTKTSPSAPSHSTSNDSSQNFVTLEQATRIANNSMQDSKDALAQVDAIQKQIQRYQSPVHSATSNFQAATSKLESAQRSLFDNPPKVPMTPVIASSSGIVQTLATLAMQVDQGEEVASIVAPNLLNLVVPDSTGMWKNLKVNAKFTVSVQTSADTKSLVSTDARLVSITPPTRPGKPSFLHIQVFNPVAQATQKPQAPTNKSIDTAKPNAQARVFSPGMIAICSIPTSSELTIPRSALRVTETKQYQVAVLKPESAVAASEKYLIQWSNVLVKGDDESSANVVISTGLTPGDRIATQPEMLYNLTVAKGNLATVQVSKK